MIGRPQFERLVKLGAAAIWAADALIPTRALAGVAHVHAHHLNAKVQTIVFRVIDGKAVAPRWCFGRCEGVLR